METRSSAAANGATRAARKPGGRRGVQARPDNDANSRTTRGGAELKRKKADVQQHANGIESFVVAVDEEERPPKLHKGTEALPAATDDPSADRSQSRDSSVGPDGRVEIDLTVAAVHSNSRPPAASINARKSESSLGSRGAAAAAASSAGRPASAADDNVEDALVGRTSRALPFEDVIPVVDIDLFDHTEPQNCTAYVHEIFEHLREKELEDPITNYFPGQHDITDRHRLILVDWMSEVVSKFRLMSETMFLATQITDRFLKRKKVARKKLQLVGVTSMLIASKMEEILTPEINDFVWVTAKAYTREEIVQMERCILATLDYSLALPTPLHFLRRFSKAAFSDSRIHTLSKYMSETSVLSFPTTMYRPSVIAASCVYLARKMLCPDQEPWNPTLDHYTQVTEDMLLPCAKSLNEFMKWVPSSKYTATFDKYKTHNMYSVALMPPPDL